MKKKRIFAAIISVALALTVLLCVVPSLAKYIQRQGRQSEIVADSFYFSSDYLKSDETPTYTVFGNSVTFEARNYIDELRVNQTDVTYTVATESEETGVHFDVSGGTLTGGSARSNAITLTYDFAGEETEKQITVSLSSTQPYAKTLRATFVLKKTNLKYEIQDAAGQYSAELYVHVGNSAQTVTLSWDNIKLSIDPMSDYVFGKTVTTSGNESSLVLDGIPSDFTFKIIFFKHNITASYACALTGSDGSIRIA